MSNAATTDKLLTSKERARLDKVREMLKAGINPYEVDSLETLKIGGKSRLFVEPENDDDRLRQEARDDADFAKREARWKAGITKTTNTQKYRGRKPRLTIKWPSIDADLLPDMGEMVAIKDPSKLWCSFCGIEVDEIRATRGVGPSRVKKDTEIIRIDVDVTVIEERTYVTSRKLVACPDCVLNITPNLDEDGDIINQGVRF